MSMSIDKTIAKIPRVKPELYIAVRVSQSDTHDSPSVVKSLRTKLNVLKIN